MFSDYSSSRRKRSLPILVVDDNSDHQLLIGYSLRASIPEAEPIFTTTAEETLRYLNECLIKSMRFPQLVMLDLYLPKADNGWRLLTELRTRSVARHCL